jgi:hypothetical protein
MPRLLVAQPMDLELAVRDRVLVNARLAAAVAAKRRRELLSERLDEVRSPMGSQETDRL